MEYPMKLSPQLGQVALRYVPLLIGMALIGAAPVARGASEQRPDPPASLDAFAVSAQQTELAWAPASSGDGVQRYSIHRNGAWLATVGSRTPAFIDLDVQASQTYTYTVRAIGTTDDSSLASNIAVVQVPALPETLDISPPSAPAALTATAVPGGVLLDWYDAADDSDLTAYLIRRNGLEIKIVRSGVLSYLDPSAPPEGAIYTVEAIDVVGHHSGLSNAAVPAVLLTK